MKASKLYSLLFRAKGVQGPRIHINTEDGVYEARCVEWDHATELLLEIDIKSVKGNILLNFTPKEARELGDIFIGFAKAYQRFDEGREAGHKERYEIEMKAKVNDL